jgi:hypothetical protein
MKLYLRLSSIAGLVLSGLLASACSDPTDLAHDQPDLRKDRVGPACLPGCTDTDPNPTYPGVYLSSFVNPEECRVGTDEDLDRLSRRCENDLAYAFAPSMRHHSGDYVQREGYWAAQWENYNTVKILYMFGYYVDEGVQGSNNHTACELSSLSLECDGHSGDSEHVVLYARYNEITQHWLLYSASLSHHGGHILAIAGTKGYLTGFAYSRKFGADPIIWVAQGKHANYPSQAACDAGNGGGYLVDLIFSYDTCGGNNSFFRATTGGTRNIGSNAKRILNCILSQNPFYQDPPRRAECFWSDPRFYGWQLDRTTSAAGYSEALTHHGFK